MQANVNVRHFLIALLFLAGPTAVHAQPKEYAQSYHEPLKDKLKNADDFKWIGPDASNCVKVEPDGLRITLPPGMKRPPIGVETAFGVTGDFEITVAYEMLQEPKPADAGGSGTGTKISLTVNLNRLGTNDASIRRKITNTRGPHIIAWRRLKFVDSPNDDRSSLFPVQAKTGRFRLVRTGAALAYYLADGPAAEFALLDTFPLGAEDVKDVQIVGSSDSDTAALDARFTDLHIRAASLPRKLPPPKIEHAKEPKIPQKEYAQSYVQSFKGSDLKPDGWNYASRLSEQAVQFEKAGLRIALDPGPEKGQSAGLVSAFGVKGDFEITYSFEVLKDPDPADTGKGGTRLSMAITLDNPSAETPKSEVATLSRSMNTRGFITWMRNRDKPASTQDVFPTPTMHGKLRMVRGGDELYFFASLGVDQPLLFLRKYRFGSEDLKRVVITASTGGPKSELDVRVTDLRIRADAIPGAPDVEITTAARKDADAPPTPQPQPERSKIWLVAGATVVFLMLVVLVLALLLRKRGAPKPVAEEAVTATVTFACAKCAKALKTNAAMAGKKVKCPKCGTPAVVPVAETSES